MVDAQKVSADIQRQAVPVAPARAEIAQDGPMGPSTRKACIGVVDMTSLEPGAHFKMNRLMEHAVCKIGEYDGADLRVANDMHPEGSRPIVTAAKRAV